MKHLRLVLLVLPAFALCAHAADDDEASAPQDDIPDFSNLDEFVYQPKSNATVGMRYVSGAKTSFSGNSYLAAPETIPVFGGTGFYRIYHDGVVAPDTRTYTVTNSDGLSVEVPIIPDGKTNHWNYDTSGQENAAGTGTTSQVTPDDYMQMHIYSAQTTDDLTHEQDGRGTSGVELRSDHDMGKIGKHFSWSIFGGVSLNDIQSSMFVNVSSAVTTLTDTYNLFGQTVPQGPYFAPSTSQQNTVINGQDVLNSAGGNIIQTVDTTVLLGSAPLSRTTVTATDDVSSADHFKLHGAYLAFRGGPALSYNFNEHIKFTVSAGPELLDASSTYTVTAVFTPATGNQIIATYQDIEDKVLPAVYADATLEYDITDRAGIYFGAFCQDAGSYVQTVGGFAEQSATSDGSYATKVDFSTQEGIRGGMSFKF